MSPEERLRILGCLAAIAAVYVLAAWFGLRQLARRSSAALQFRGEVPLRRAVYGLAGFGLLCGLYARFVEPYWVDVTHVDVKPGRWHGPRLRVVHLSDIHSDPVARLEERLPDIVQAEHPDLIVYTGDSLNAPEGLPVFKRCMTALARIAPTYAVRGNWDVWYWHALDLFGGTGVVELANTSRVVILQGNPVWIGGLSVGGEEALPELAAEAPADALRVLLHHYPDEVLNAAERRMDLYLAGHTHGGQVALPFYGALATLSKFGKRFESGLYRVGSTWAYVNRGIGMEGGSAPRVRFAARPEVTVIDVLPPWGVGSIMPAGPGSSSER